jgi:steroid 5-alpha reductase family enzyme
MAFEFFQMAFYDDIFKYFILACNGIALLVWLTTVVTGNYSQMDRLWPILPMVYSWAYLYTSINFTPDKRSHDLNTSIIKTSESRLIIMSCLITAWGLRMAFTFWRRGYYSYGHEDHRWPEVQKRFTSKLSLFLFNFIFMGFVQNWILFGYALPMWFLQTNKTSVSTLNILDYVMIGLYLFGYLIEAIADEQQQLFQTNKYKWLDEQKNKKSNTKFSQQEIEDFKRGFMVRGLFKFSRQ